MTAQAFGEFVEVLVSRSPQFSLKVTPTDGMDVQFVSRKTGLSNTEAQRLALLLKGVVTEPAARDEVSKPTFDKFFKALVQSNPPQSEQDNQKLSYFLSSVFFGVDHRGVGRVERKDLLAALSFICAGSKSAKLAFGFTMYDEDGDGALDSFEFRDYIRSLLSMMFSMTKSGRSMEDWPQKQLVAQTARNLWQEIMTSSFTTNKVLLGFDEFSQWYNAGGFESAPWLELLDINKWPTPSAPTAPPAPLVPEANKSGPLRTVVEEPSSEDLVYRFQIDNLSIDISRETIAMARNLVENSSLQNLQLEHMYRSLVLFSDDGMLTKAAFDQCTRKFISGSVSTEDNRKEFSMILSTVFYGFDRTDDEVVDVVELACGFSMLCEGSKSAKLAFAFDLMDEDEDGFLTRRGLWRYFRSFLCVLLTLSGTALEMSTEEMNNACDSGADWTCNQAFGYFTRAGQTSSSVSFDDIADWYTNGGYSVAPWLELLDLTKWMVPEVETQLNPSAPPPEEIETPQPYPVPSTTDMQVTETFCFELSKDLSLTIISQDAIYVKEIATATGLASMTADELLSVFRRVCSGDVIHRSQFNDVFSAIVPARTLTDEDHSLLMYALSNTFNGFDTSGDEHATVTSVVVGLSVLCAGSKSSKLAFGFQMFDSDGDGCLRVEELQAFLVSYLRMLFACSFEAMNMDPSMLVNSINEFSLRVSREIALSCNSLVDFPGFGEWYNSGGFMLIPWLELLDLSKWQSQGIQSKHQPVDGTQIHTHMGAPLSAQLLPPPPQATNTQPASGQLEDNFVFSFQVDGEPLFVAVTPDTAVQVCGLASLMGTTLMETEDAFALLSDYSDDGLLSKQAFDRCMRQLKPANTFPSPQSKAECSSLLSLLFYCFDRAETDLVELHEIVIGFSILCKGSKSVKLAFAFDLMDEDRDGLLTRRGLWKLFRSFMCVLFAMSGAGGNVDVEQMCHICDSAALWAAAQVFQKIEKKLKRNSGVSDDQSEGLGLGSVDRISFDDIADWYTEGGYEVAPWLELLDITKWALLLGQAYAE